MRVRSTEVFDPTKQLIEKLQLKQNQVDSNTPSRWMYL